eukprot:TRINITY_DN1161_c13_g1_i1.p1 TRINITY_DN1161_c13_g1~~TRINITY_DN1161_c13_g1_i1.p1  ORF type:complete len:658 (+),score=112.61 TRINITY_DN1161_c13_g1_i1:47-2020(+)
MSSTAQPPGLMKAVRTRLENEVFKAPSETARQIGCVLVCDEWSLSLLGTCFKVNDLTKHGIPLVESLKLPCGAKGGRQSLPRYPVIYLCRCNRQNIDCILNDWKTGTSEQPKDWDVRPYAEAHVFFTSHAEKGLTGLLLPAKLLAQHLKTFKDLRMDFLPVEPHLYSLEVEKDLHSFFSKQRSPAEVEASVNNVADRILDVIQTMGDTVTVRHQKGGKCTIAYQVAKRVTQLQSERMGTNKGNTTLLILDRSLDCMAPLLHELTYQAMLLDILPKQSGVEVSPDTTPARARVITEGKNYTLDEQDELWCRTRHQHIADSGPIVSKEFSDIVSNSKALNLRNNYGSQTSSEDMAEAVKDMPFIQAKIKNYQLHINLHDVLMKQLKEGGLDAVCDIEQNLATKETAEGMKADKDDLKKQFEAYLEMSSNTSHVNKVRLMLLYIVSQGPVSKDRQAKWIGSLAGKGTPSWQTGTGAGSATQLINNLSLLDVVTEKKKWYQSKSKEKKKARVDPQSYDWSRYVPGLKSIAEAVVSNDLSEAGCPHTISDEHVSGSASTSASAGRSARKSEGVTHRSWGASLRGSDAKTSGPGSSTTAYSDALPWSLQKATKGRVYIFMIGGTTYNETRSIAEVISEKETEIVFGSTSVINSDKFIRGLSDL